MQRFARSLTSFEKIKAFAVKKMVTTIEPQRNLLNLWDIPKPRSLPLIGTKIDFLLAGGSANLHEYVHKRHQQLGPIFCEKFAKTEIVFISDPQMMKLLFLKLEGKYPAHILPDPWVLYEKVYGFKRGLFFMNGEEWLNNRRIMNKFLLREGTEKWIDAPIKNVVDIFLSKWKAKVDNKQLMPNVEAEFYRLSIDVIVAILIGAEKTNVSKHYDQLLGIFAEEVKKIFTTTTKLSALPLQICYRLNLKPWKDFKESVDVSLFLAQKLVKEMLLNGNNSGLIAKLKDENVSEENITRIVADFIIAAGDTTAYTLLWTLYLLSTNEKVIHEIRRNETYSKFVLKESMRLYPVAPFLTRILTNDVVLGSFKLRKGTPIVASIYTSGRDESNFTKADEFLPYRWDRNDIRRTQLNNFESSASLPFALGARSCIGKRIAIVQLTELIKEIVENFDIKCLNNGEIKAVTSQVLVPNKNIDLEFSIRE